MDVEVFVIRCRDMSATPNRFGYIGKIETNEKGLLNVSVIFNTQGVDIFDDEAQTSSARFFSRRKALDVRDYVVKKLTAQVPELTAQTDFEVLPKMIDSNIAAQLAISPLKIDTSK